MFATSIAVRASLLASLALAAAVTGTADARQAAAKPNLVVSSTSAGTVKIKNTGSVAAAGFTVEIRGTFEYAANYKIISGLNAGQSVVITLARKYCGGVAPTVDITADYFYAVTESSEGDNFIQIAEAESCSGS
jgi:hypothetical protein